MFSLIHTRGVALRAALVPAMSLSLLSSLTLAQSEQPARPAADGGIASTAPPAVSKRALTIDLRGGGVYTFSSDIDSTTGSVSIARASAGVGVGIPIGDRSKLSLDIDEEVSWYLFRDASGLVPGTTDPFELALSTRLASTFSSQVDDHWSWFAGGLVNIEGEPDADVGDSATYGGFGGARYSFSDSFSLSFGLAARTRLEESTLVLPLLGVQWKVSDRVTVATEGLGARITAQLNTQIAFSLSGRWELREYRLDDQGLLPSGVARDRRVPIAVSLDWKPTDNVEVSFGGGVVVWQEFRFDNSNGDRVSETNTDPAGFIGVKGKITF